MRSSSFPTIDKYSDRGSTQPFFASVLGLYLHISMHVLPYRESTSIPDDLTSALVRAITLLPS